MNKSYGAFMSLSKLNKDIIECRKCPRLVEWRERVAAEKRASFKDQEYWGKPVPSFGDPKAKLLIVSSSCLTLSG